MTNEMMRPCQPEGWGLADPFDAIGATVLPSCRDLEVYTKDGRVIRFEFATREALEIGYMDTLATIADALNAPVLASKKVLAGLPKDAKAVLIDDIGVPHSLDWVARTGIGDGWAWGDDYDVMPYHKIQAFRCPKTAEYLRQFTLDGVRRVV
jgi:hypothetical protein